MFNDKLFERYYPLKTEKEKNEFLDSNSREICRIIKRIRIESYLTENENLLDLDSLEYKIRYQEYGNIAVNELNYCLRSENFYKHRTWMACVLSSILLIVCVCIFF